MLELQGLVAAYSRYRVARKALLEAMGCSSNRDPLTEFSERLVAILTDGRLAASRVQKAWDVEAPGEKYIQVKYLANTESTWVNEHHIVFPDKKVGLYAIVIFQDLNPESVVMFSRDQLPEVCAELGKRHGNTETTLQFTRRNYETILANQEVFEKLGVRVWTISPLA